MKRITNSSIVFVCALMFLSVLGCENPSSNDGYLKIELFPKAVFIQKAETLDFDADGRYSNNNKMESEDISWYASYPSIVQINDTGRVIGQEAGLTEVICISDSFGISDSAHLLVSRDPIDSIRIQHFITRRIPLGDSIEFHINVYNIDGNLISSQFEPVWKSESEAIASIDEDGFCTGKTIGETQIIAQVEEFSDSILVDIVSPDDF